MHRSIHATDWARGGRTDLKTMAIACGYHNTEGPKQGWKTLMLKGVPHWLPPPWHPERQPMRNYLHHPELLSSRESQPQQEEAEGSLGPASEV